MLSSLLWYREFNSAEEVPPMTVTIILRGKLLAIMLWRLSIVWDTSTTQKHLSKSSRPRNPICVWGFMPGSNILILCGIRMTYIFKVTIAIITRWGAGKSSLIEMIIKELEDTGRSRSLEQPAINIVVNEDSKNGKNPQSNERTNSLIERINVLLQKLVDAFWMKISVPTFLIATNERITTLLKKMEVALDLPVNILLDLPVDILLLVYSVFRIVCYWCICYWYSGYSGYSDSLLQAFCIFIPSALSIVWQNTTLLALEIVYFIRHGEPSYKKISQKEHKKAKKAKEFVIVKFNAWEFSDSEELWAGLIKGIYNEVEERMSKEKDSFGVSWKEIWRLKKSFEFLVETYGEQSFYLHSLSVILISIVFVIQVFFFTIPELKDKAFDKDDYLALFLNAASGFTSIKILNDIISVSSKKLFTSIGEAIVQESKSISDRTGFLSSVKKELSELFKFIKEDFCSGTGVVLTLVLIVDDLDRVFEGRSVKMLEAMQLVLNVPGAPVFIFLAIDSRIVVASIEHHIGKSLDIKAVRLSGHEFLEKIVQVPFSLPEVCSEWIENYVTVVLTKSITEEDVEELIRDFISHCESVEKDHSAKDPLCQLTVDGNIVEKSVKDIQALKGEVGKR